MSSIRSAVTLLFVMTLGLAASVAAQPIDNTFLGVGAFSNNTTGAFNTALGASALEFNTTGNSNTATGAGALGVNTTGNNNTATGAGALGGNTAGEGNTATGSDALGGNTTGIQNTAAGESALSFNTTGSTNTAVGSAALMQNTTGSGNIAIGANAGLNVTTGNHNIHIGNNSVAGDNLVVRIGVQGLQTSTSIAGIFGATVIGRGAPVEVNSLGQLGTVLSSRRVKADIRAMDDASEGLGKLRPVTFRYKAEPVTGTSPLEYGLIAEEVAEIYPELVVRDVDGQPAGVRYHVLPAMLLNELQRQQREIMELRAKLQEIDELRAYVRALIGAKAAVVP